MHISANPARFLKIARPLTAWLGWSGVALSWSAMRRAEREGEELKQ